MGSLHHFFASSCADYRLPRWLSGKQSCAHAGNTGLEGPLEKGMATHASNLAWRIPWTEDPGRLQSWVCKELDMTEHTCVDFLFLLFLVFFFIGENYLLVAFCEKKLREAYNFFTIWDKFHFFFFLRTCTFKNTL